MTDRSYQSVPDQSDPGPQHMSVAPGAHFNIRLSWNDLGEATLLSFAKKGNCDGNLFLKNSHGQPTYC